MPVQIAEMTSTIQSGIFGENTASLAWPASAGFRVVGRRERLGRLTYGPLAGQWRPARGAAHRTGLGDRGLHHVLGRAAVR